MTVLLLQGRVLVTVWSLWLASGNNETGIREGTHASLCGEYSNRATANGTCRLVATVPQLEGRRCPDLFRCTDEVSYWLHENDERKQQMADLKETISELQEELRNHRHRINVLELQVKPAFRPFGTFESNEPWEVQGLPITIKGTQRAFQQGRLIENIENTSLKCAVQVCQIVKPYMHITVYWN